MSSGSGVKKDAFAGSGNATNMANLAYNTITPTYAQMASGNDGLTPQQMADARTASGQSIGGSTAGIVGQGALDQARTGNVGSYAAIADAVARTGAQQQSANSLGVQNESDQVARDNQRIGLAGEQNILNSQSQDAISYLNTANGAQKPYWQQLLSQGLGAAGQVASAYAGS